MDIVFVEGLEVFAVVGVHPFERGRARPLLIDAELGFDNRAAAVSDSVADSVDYDAVCRRIAALAAAAQPALLESLAERIADALIRDFALPWLRLRIAKPGAVPQARSVGIVIERGRRI